MCFFVRIGLSMEMYIDPFFFLFLNRIRLEIVHTINHSTCIHSEVTTILQWAAFMNQLEIKSVKFINCHSKISQICFVFFRFSFSLWMQNSSSISFWWSKNRNTKQLSSTIWKGNIFSMQLICSRSAQSQRVHCAHMCQRRKLYEFNWNNNSSTERECNVWRWIYIDFFFLKLCQ